MILQIMPIIMPIDSGGGPVDPIAVLSILILFNVLTISIFVLRALWWLISIRHKDQNKLYHTKTISFYRYCINSDMESMIDFNTITFVTINGITLITVGSWWIYRLLGGTLPLF